MVFSPPTHFTLFKQRRQKFIDNIKQSYGASKGVVIISAGFEAERLAFRQESSFYYLTGIVEPAALLFLCLDGREILYLPRFSTARDQWVSVLLSGPDDARKVDVDRIAYLGKAVAGYSFKPIFTRENYENLLFDLASIVDGHAKVFTLLDRNNPGYFMHINLYERFCEWLPGLEECTEDISHLLHQDRRQKDAYEVDLIYKAVQVTNMAQRAAATMISPGKYEYEIQVAVECVFTHVAGAIPAFPSIVATGKNTTILHYTQRNASLGHNDLVVVDIGAEYGFYAADLTRTYPASGKFTDRQREVYTAVLETQAYIESIAVPGMYLKNAQNPEQSLHHLAVKFLEKKGFAQYFCHGIGHYLGLDVHDVGDYQTPLQTGDVFTIEPGIYIAAESLGVRIEDDYVMADDGAVCLSYELPKQPDDIEKMMQNHHASVAT